VTAPVTSATLGAGYFDAMYKAAPDPWGFEERWYERRKYAISLAQLPHRRYRSAFEPGCSIGVLARRCDRLLSCDVAAAAVRTATRRTRGLPNVRIERRQIPAQWPAGSFDLVVFSEMLYYFGDRDLEEVLDRGVRALRPGGTLLAVHWRHPVADYPRSGDDVHRVLVKVGTKRPTPVRSKARATGPPVRMTSDSPPPSASARRCARTSTLKPAESHNRVRLRSTTRVACPLAAGPDRIPAALPG
jgi:SAM-dependent methyltransferase